MHVLKERHACTCAGRAAPLFFPQLGLGQALPAWAAWAHGIGVLGSMALLHLHERLSPCILSCFQGKAHQ